MIKKFTHLTMILVATIGLSFSSFAQLTDLIISEYSEGTSNNKYIEIYNGTGASVNLGDYEMWKLSNGGAWPSNTMTLSGSLADGSTYILAHASSDAIILAAADTAFNGQIVYFNGNDAVGLAKDDGTGNFILIDAVGEQGTAAYWDVAGTTAGTQNHTLIRKDNVCSPDTNWTVSAGTTAANSQWVVMPQNDWTDIGMHTSTCAAQTSSDTTKPVVMDGIFNSATSITVVYSEAVTMATATDLANYAITPGITITAASQSTTLDSVTLTLSPGLTNGTLFTANIMNVADTSSNANVMDPFSTSFYFNDYNGSDLLITEIMYGQNGSGVQDIDYFEVHNSGAAAISVAGMELVSGMDLFIDSNVSIAAGGYMVFTENVDSFMLAFPTVTNVIGVDGGSLSGGGELIAMENTLGDVVFSVDYETSAPWPSYTGDGSIELCDLTTDNTMGTNWYYAGTVSSTVADMLYGTPGAANSCAAPPTIPTYDIALVRTNDANGEPDSMGVYCALEGIVHGVNLHDTRLSFTIIDETHGINVFSFSNPSGYVITEGDFIRVVGEIDQHRGLAEIVPDSITVLSTGNCIEYPTIVTDLNEETESNYIEFQGVMMDPTASWPAPGSTANIDFITANGDTLTMRVSEYTQIQDSILNMPSGVFNLIGIGGQYDASTSTGPFEGGYQIFPMFVSDFDTVPSTVTDIFVNEALHQNSTVIADPQGEYDSWIEIYNGNNTAMDLTGMFITNYYMTEAYRFPRCETPITVPANGFKLLWADDQPEDGEDHLPFEIFGTDVVSLLSKDYMVIDSLDWDSSLTDISVGYDSDGSGTMVSFELTTPEASNTDGWVLSVVNALEVNPINVYPNPSTTGNINFNKVVSFNMYSITGQLVMTQNNVNRVKVSSLEKGVYILETTEGEVVKVILK